ncbi:MAG: response regulator transcription factor [Candidatus Omnitrophica bacterium]|nr:response regulator transcription factor [Candidatus Omnitrophota bacterium]
MKTMNKRGQIIYVVDDDVSVCLALKLLLESHGFRVETFNCAKDFLTFKHLKMSSCLLLDVQLPDVSGMLLQESLAILEVVIPVVFITGHGDIPMSVKAMQHGAIDFLPKPFTEDNLLKAIERAIAKNKIDNKSQGDVDKIKERIKTLSPRELEVFHLVAQGLMNKQIASRWGTALQTIKVHRGRVMQKMQAKTATELIHLAQKAGLSSSLD